MESTSAALIKSQEAHRSKQTAILLAAAALLAAIILAVNIAHYLPFLSDDALISLRYSQRLIQGHGLTWNDGQRVEGYSNFLWVMLVAGLGLLRMDLVDAARLLGIASTLATGAALLYGSARKLAQPASLLSACSGLLVLALAGPVAAWAIGGLEQPLFAALLAWGLVLSYPLFQGQSPSFHAVQLPGLLFGLLALTRPDGILIAGLVLAALFVTRGFHRETFRLVFSLALLPAGLFLAQLGFRLWYYGQWVPNTALVKVSLSRAHILAGLEYIGPGLLALTPMAELALLAGLVCLLDHKLRGRALLLLAAAGGWLAYITLVGGDIFPAWRHLVPVVVVMALLLALGVEAPLARLKTPAAQAGLALALLALLIWFGFGQLRDPENVRASTEKWEWDGQAVGLLLKDGFTESQPLLAIDPAGAVPFWSELPSLDMLGLNDYYLPRHPPKNFGHGWIGHELGDGAYVLSQRPDLVLFCLPRGSADPCFISGQQMTEDPSFYEHYSLAQFESSAPQRVRALVWVRRDSPSIGIRAENGGLTIPAYFFTADQKSAATLAAGGGFSVSLAAGQSVTLSALALAAGQWRVEAEASGPLAVTVQRSGRAGMLLKAGPPGALFTAALAKDSPVDLVITASEPLDLRQVRLVRVKR